MSKEKTGVTGRGFALVTFRDHNNIECSLQQSGVVDLDAEGGLEHPGSSCVWLGCDDADPQEFVPFGDPSWRPVKMPKDYIANTRMHLDRAQVAMLISHLQNWLATGSFVDDSV